MIIGYVSNSYGQDVSFQAYSFCDGLKPYAEVYLRFSSSAFKKITSEKGDFVKPTVILTFEQYGIIRNFDKYEITSPVLDSDIDFYDVKRMGLTAGTYDVKVQIGDSSDSTYQLIMEKPIVISNCVDRPNLSSVIQTGSISNSNLPSAKNGLMLEPYPLNYVSKDHANYHFYTELYLDNIVDDLFVKYAISQLNDEGDYVEVLKKAGKLNITSKVTPLVGTLPICDLRSADYKFSVHIFNRSKDTIAYNSSLFTRHNPDFDLEYWKNYNHEVKESFVSDMNEDELVYAIKAIAPILKEPKRSLKNYMIREAPVRTKKKFLLDYWVEQNKLNPELAYEEYMKIARAIDKEFSSNVGEGFETDRGYIFLRYGNPNNIISIDTEVDAPPYEIWYYDYIETTHQWNVRFIFYNPSLVHNDFQLLHSTCRIEKQNPAWEVELYRSMPMDQIGNSIDATEIKDNFNRNAKRYFNDY